MCRRQFGSVSLTASVTDAQTDDRLAQRCIERSGSQQYLDTPHGSHSISSPVRFVLGPQPPLPPQSLSPLPVPLVSPPLPQTPVATSPRAISRCNDSARGAAAARPGSVLSPAGVRPELWPSLSASYLVSYPCILVCRCQDPASCLYILLAAAKIPPAVPCVVCQMSLCIYNYASTGPCGSSTCCLDGAEYCQASASCI